MDTTLMAALAHVLPQSSAADLAAHLSDHSPHLASPLRAWLESLAEGSPTDDLLDLDVEQVEICARLLLAIAPHRVRDLAAILADVHAAHDEWAGLMDGPEMLGASSHQGRSS